jgi:hypothetical protein
MAYAMFEIHLQMCFAKFKYIPPEIATNFNCTRVVSQITFVKQVFYDLQNIVPVAGMNRSVSRLLAARV